MRKVTWILVAVLGASLAAGTAWSFGAGEEAAPAQTPAPTPPMGRMQGPQGPMPMMMGMGPEEELGLTDEQSEKLRGLSREALKNGIRARAEMQIAQMELDELMGADTPDRAAIETKLRQLSEAQNRLLRQHIEHRLAMQQVLTPEQRAKARKLFRRHLRQRWSGRGMRMRGPHGHRGEFGPGRGFRRGPGFGPQGLCPGCGFGPGPGFAPGADFPVPAPPEE